MKLKPLGDRLIVKAVEEEETTASGIVLPDTAKEKPQRGKVLAVGDGKVSEETGKRIGDELPIALAFGQVAEGVHELVPGGEEGIAVRVGRRGTLRTLRRSHAPRPLRDDPRETPDDPFGDAAHGHLRSGPGGRGRCRHSHAPRGGQLPAPARAP